MSSGAHLKETERPAHRRNPNGTRKYLYAVIGATPEPRFDSLGINNGEVYCIHKGRVVAVVSDITGEKLRPERRHLAVHQQVLRSLMQQTTPLPLCFGVVAEDFRSVQRILNNNEEAFLDTLRRVAGKVEMGLRVTWDVANVFEYFVNTHPELKAARDRFLGGQRAPTQEEKIEVGRFFDRVLQEDREDFADRVDGILSPCCSEIKRNKCRGEREVMNLACLVAKEKQGEFEAAILEAARLFDNNFAFDYNGPWAPHNFVEMDLEP